MKKFHKLAALCAALALTCSFTTVAYAASVTSSSSAAASSSSATSSTTGTSSTSTVFTPAGTGTVVNTATDADGKEFYTITTPDKNVFYLVIDRQRDGDNVYFLNAVTEKDLLALAEKSGSSSASTGTTTANSASSSTQTTTSGTVSQPGTEIPAKFSSTPQSNNMGTLLLVLAVVVIGGGAGYYFKIYRPKHQRADSEDDFDYSDENGSDDAEGSEQSDELPQSKDDDGGDGEA